VTDKSPPLASWNNGLDFGKNRETLPQTGVRISAHHQLKLYLTEINDAFRVGIGGQKYPINLKFGFFDRYAVKAVGAGIFRGICQEVE
jgi:hypothetical protein